MGILSSIAAARGGNNQSQSLFDMIQQQFLKSQAPAPVVDWSVPSSLEQPSASQSGQPIAGLSAPNLTPPAVMPSQQANPTGGAMPPPGGGVEMYPKFPVNAGQQGPSMPQSPVLDPAQQGGGGGLFSTVLKLFLGKG